MEIVADWRAHVLSDTEPLQIFPAGVGPNMVGAYAILRKTRSRFLTSLIQGRSKKTGKIQVDICQLLAKLRPPL